MLQFLDGSSDLPLNVLQILVLILEPLQFGSKSITVCGVRFSSMTQTSNLSLHISARGSRP
ncbi:hypothetical protein [Microvirga yunnanensis]|uniref:hypothetical protein n=1 Tax=Microvirga yunnanensis TaxID=2953740 RepID=UPI0021CA2018|nr:hypothetical protein [Microvirga sp. HBU65207]